MKDEELCEWLRGCDSATAEQAANRLEALRAERDAAAVRAERAEAENARLRTGGDDGR